MEKRLTAKQIRFIEEYLISGNATAAAIRAGYSEKTAAEMAYENLRKPHVEAEIARIASGHAKEDNWIDLAGYAACGGELQSRG